MNNRARDALIFGGGFGGLLAVILGVFVSMTAIAWALLAIAFVATAAGVLA